ncbi:hypothetical protein JTB14_028638 [Gonioctena quinquepunctata]|nr:hypothetical protein JTB14_028638 [Gonioctena quinquepunctata]
MRNRSTQNFSDKPSKMKWNFIDDYDVTNVGYDMANLTLDQFYLTIKSTSFHFKEIYLYTLNEECYKVSEHLPSYFVLLSLNVLYCIYKN